MEDTLYNDALADEWIDWVETPDSNGTREREIYPFIKEWLEKTKPKVLCDIGCGQGSCSELVKSETEYIGIDPSPILIGRANKLYRSRNKKFILGDAYHTPLEDNAVDSIVSVWVWSHLDNLDLAAKEILRILIPRGKFLIITANPETYEERKTFYKHYTIEGNLLKGTFDLGNSKFLTGTTLYLHTRQEIENAIKRVGLKIKSIKRMGRVESSDKGLYLAIEGSR